MTQLLKAMGLAALILLGAVHCGKKGPLVLEPELLPQQITSLHVTQVGETLKLQWEFPAQLAGNTKEKELLQVIPEEIRQIYIYYSSKELPGDKFQKKADMLRKFTFAELTPVSTVTTTTTPAAPVSLLAPPQVKKTLTFSVTLPFPLKNLDNKQHFFALQYEYRRHKSPLSAIAYIASVIPTKVVEGLAVTRENKIIKLTWKRPDKDVAERPTAAIAGYNVFKKIVSDEPAPTTQPGDAKKSQPNTGANNKEALKKQPGVLAEPGSFRKLNPDKVLLEYFEDTDTGTNGKYSYYVSTIVANNIESAPSAEVSIQVVDTYPPEAPANLVCFKAEDHMFLTWQVVPDTDFAFFRVYRSLNPDSEFVLVSDNLPTNQYKDKTVTKGKTYYYVVTAIDKKGNESLNSNTAREQF